MRKKEIRELPGVQKRVETGAIRFGKDHPGLFIRRDDCFALAIAWKAIQRHLKELSRNESLSVQPLYNIQPFYNIMEVISKDVDYGDTIHRMLNTEPPREEDNNGEHTAGSDTD